MSRPKILLVDDNRLFLEMEKEFLQPCAVRIYTARTGQEALDVVRLVLPDLVFMDLHMPEMDGAACCAAIKSDPDLKLVPVVMIVTPDGDDLEQCRRAGCDFVLTKPVDRGAFIKTGHRFLPAIDRIETRIPCLTLVVFRIGGKAFYGTSANLSTSGMFIAFDDQVELEDLIRLSFLVPGSDGVVIEATGRVAWENSGTPLCKPSLPRGFGVAFQEIQPEAVRAIAHFMSRAENSGVAPFVEGAYLAESLF
jgi:CheY-like chemotaxis protein